MILYILGCRRLDDRRLIFTGNKHGLAGGNGDHLGRHARVVAVSLTLFKYESALAVLEETDEDGSPDTADGGGGVYLESRSPCYVAQNRARLASKQVDITFLSFARLVLGYSHPGCLCDPDDIAVVEGHSGL